MDIDTERYEWTPAMRLAYKRLAAAIGRYEGRIDSEQLIVVISQLLGDLTEQCIHIEVDPHEDPDAT
jgi:hypothetical protein